jgi:ligand-binding sensor domain-containing protein/signal transduction histidine kinase
MGILRGREFVLSGTILAFVLLAWCPSAFALNPSLDVSQYAHTSWKIRDGFTKGRIYSIAQTPDGYLWLGTEFGLLRFDGVRNVPFQPPADQRLPSSTIIQLLAARDGTLWIGTDKGLASWNGDRLTRYPELDGQFVFALLEDRDGAVWVGTYSLPTGKLCAIQNGGVQCYGEDGSLGRGVTSLYEDGRGNLWAEGQNGLWRWKPGSPEFFSLPDNSPTKQNLAEDFDGALLIGTDAGIERLVDGRIEAYSMPGYERKLRAKQMLRDSDGSLWIGTVTGGLVHIHQGRTDVFSQSGGLSGDVVDVFFEDHEGDIWVATMNGLDRFRDLAVPTFSVGQGLSNANVESVLAARDGSVLLTTTGGLNRWNNGQITIYGGSAAQGQQNTNVPHSLFQDDRGRIWAVTLREFGYLEDERFIPVSGVPGGVSRSIVEDAEGSLWVANQYLGLFHLKGSEVARRIPWEKLGHKDFAAALAFDPSKGGVWLGFFQGGIAYFRDGKVEASYAVADGLGEGRVNDLRLDQDDALWVATEGGLSRLKNNRIATLTSKNGLPCDTIHWVMEDDAHAFWLYTACGLVRVARAELEAWAAAVDQGKDAKRNIRATVFDITDGVTSRAYPIGFSPQVAKSADGKLWFPGMDGVSVLDPNHLPFNRLPPPVHVEQIIADRKTYEATSPAGGRVRLPPLVRDLEIDYTALSLAAPEKVLFRYKLENFDRDWQEAGNRRQAFYNNLPPGDYRFRVLACNNSGVWNETGTFLDFSIAPAYYQTAWFRLLFVAVFILLLGALYQLRLRQVAGQVRGRMEERLAERERIARDLHDTLLQSVQGLILKFHAVATQMRRDEPAYDALEKTLDQADRVLAEGRDSIKHLRGTAEASGDLPAAFQRVVEETPRGGDVAFKTVIEGSVRELHPIIREESYCIGREALVNALTHSEGRHVEVEITYDPRQFRLRVRDDGRGIDPAIIEEGRPDHWGLRGMRERAQRIGAQLNLWSRAETGTEVELTVPGATAYRVPGVKAKRLWSRRSPGAG